MVDSTHGRSGRTTLHTFYMILGVAWIIIGAVFWLFMDNIGVGTTFALMGIVFIAVPFFMGAGKR